LTRRRVGTDVTDASDDSDANASATGSGTFDVGGDLTVNRLGFGAMRLTGSGIIGPPGDEAAARGVLRRAVELGVQFVDTADSYGPGVSERLVGEELGPDDEDVVVASKAGLLRNVDGDWTPRGDPEFLRNQVLCSRDRLGVETVDLYQFHRPDPDVPFAESVHAFAEMRDEGLVRHVGLSNVDVDQLDEAREIVEIATVQNRYNVGDRSSEAVLEACEAAGVGFLPWYPLGGGGVEGAAVLDEVAAAHDATRQQVALAWLLDHSPVVVPIPGTASRAHLEENVAAASLSLTDADRARLDDVDPQ
jgi:aryl-alcohol dehydrogenase-like predicted oxidoreductase